MTVPVPAQLASWAQPVVNGPVNLPGPAQSSMLVHFTGRPPGTGSNPGLDLAIAVMTPPRRLDAILWDGVIRAGVPFGATLHAVSLSEASPQHLSWLVRERGFPSWALLFDKQAIFDIGGGPVWYARPDALAQARGTAAAEWAVRYDTTPGSRSDWTHEQEWRLHADPTTVGGLHLAGSGLIGILVDDPNWMPLRWGRLAVGPDGTPVADLGLAAGEVEAWWLPPAGRWPLPRYWLDPHTGALTPVPASAPHG